MASFMLILMAITFTTISFMVSPSFSLSSPQLKVDPIAAAPVVLPKISPDISPLLPSSGGVFVPSTASASIPTIPSNPSQNPDEVTAFSPDSALSPSGMLPDSSAVGLSLIRSLEFQVVMVLLSCWLVQFSAV